MGGEGRGGSELILGRSAIGLREGSGVLWDKARRQRIYYSRPSEGGVLQRTLKLSDFLP